MKQTVLVVALVFTCAAATMAQSAAKSVFAELGGPGLASVNFDTRFTKNQNGVGGRIGFGGFSLGGASLFLVPAAVNYLIGNNTSHYFELGAGATFSFASADVGDGNNKVFNNTFGHLNLGYRYQPQNSGVTFRVAVNPLFGNGVFWPVYGGVSVGYKF
ncbi:MAG: hypothetical protein ACK4E8_02565 [Lacibacter sp.]|jgi:hypothetical protein